MGRRILPVAGVALGVIAWSPQWPSQVRVPALVGLALAMAGTVVVLGRLEPAATRQRRVQMVTDLPQVLDLLVAGLAAGQPLRAATAAVVDVMDGPLAEELSTLSRQVSLGRPEAEAWLELRQHPVLGAIATDLARSVASGTRLTELLAGHAAAARRQRHAQLEAMAKAVGVRCVLPLMICFLPAFLLVGVVPVIASVLAAALPW